MRTDESVLGVVSKLVLAEASVWLTRLQDAECTTDKAAFKEWLAADPAHARAFARVSDVWELIPGAVVPTQPPKVVPHHRARPWRRPWLSAAACVVLLLIAVSVGRRSTVDFHVYQTAVGEQKTIVLADNTRVTLNTDTRIAVGYSNGERSVRFIRGEALFRVVKNPKRPFVVRTGNERIEDLGTVFDVTRYARRTTVTLLEGAVRVSARGGRKGGASRSAVLKPGERLVVAGNDVWEFDWPHVQDVMAWRQGQVYFDDATLADAVTKINRYNRSHLQIADQSLGALRISGVFSTRAPDQFASAVAALHNLRVVHERGAIVLKR